MTNQLKMVWSSARAYVNFIDGGGPDNTASVQVQPAIIEVVLSLFVCFAAIQYNTIQ